MFVLMFWIDIDIKMSVVTLMRWHAELKRDITEYVLTLFVLELWCSSWHYDVDMYIIYDQNNHLLKKLNRRLNIMMLVLTLWCSSWHYDIQNNFELRYVGEWLFLYANRLKLCMRIDFNVGDSNCRRNDFDVCESTKVVSAKRPTSSGL